MTRSQNMPRNAAQAAPRQFKPAQDPETDKADEARFGFWVFLMSDLVIFSLLFGIYATMLGARAGGPGPGALFHLGSAAIQTAFLLTSSFTFSRVTLAVSNKGSAPCAVFWLAVTLVLGLGFLGFEINDFLTMLNINASPSRSGYLSAFFGLVGTHGLHVASGCIWILVMLAQIVRFELSPDVISRITRLGLFWHFLDVVWIGIFSIVYLMGLAQ